MYYLFKQSIAYRKKSEFPLKAMFDFKNVIFNRCQCLSDPLKPHCFEVETNFQNIITFLPNELFLIALFTVPLAMHILQAALLKLTPPIPMINFVLGTKYEDEVLVQEDIEMKSMNNDSQLPSERQDKLLGGKKFEWHDFICLFLGIGLLLGMGFLPYGYHKLFVRDDLRNGK